MCAGGACVLACVGMGWGYTREEVLGRNCRFLHLEGRAGATLAFPSGASPGQLRYGVGEGPRQRLPCPLDSCPHRIAFMPKQRAWSLLWCSMSAQCTSGVMKEF